MGGHRKERRGIRSRYRELLDPVHFNYPRKTLVHHRIEWYLGEEPEDRPTFGVYAMACFAEYLLNIAKFGSKSKRATFPDAARFYAATRSALQNTLSTYHIGSRLSPEETESLRRVVRRLVESAREAYEAVMHGGTHGKCPACAGRGLVPSDARLLEALLYEQSRNGTIPETSELYRPELLTP